MSNEPDQQGDYESLKRENSELREKLAHATLEVEMHRQTAKEWHFDRMPDEPLTESEVNGMLHGPHGRSPWEMLEEFERTLPREGQ